MASPQPLPLHKQPVVQACSGPPTPSSKQHNNHSRQVGCLGSRHRLNNSLSKPVGCSDSRHRLNSLSRPVAFLVSRRRPSSSLRRQDSASSAPPRPRQARVWALLGRARRSLPLVFGMFFRHAYSRYRKLTQIEGVLNLKLSRLKLPLRFLLSRSTSTTCDHAHDSTILPSQFKTRSLSLTEAFKE